MSAGPRIVLEYQGIDAFVVPHSALDRRFVTWYREPGRPKKDGFKTVVSMVLPKLFYPISPSGSQKFIQDFEQNQVDFNAVKFKLIDQIGHIVGYMEHDLVQKCD